MKIRSGFVSNSSSSSFILSLPDKEENVFETVVSILLDGELISSRKELDDYASHNYWVNASGEFSDPYYKEQYNKYLEHIEIGRVVMVMVVDNYNDRIISVLRNKEFYKKNDIILVEEAY